jgi:hypothetical protein
MYFKSNFQPISSEKSPVVKIKADCLSIGSNTLQNVKTFDCLSFDEFLELTKVIFNGFQCLYNCYTKHKKLAYVLP